MVTVPPTGPMEHKADVAEEIARIYGYKKFPVTAIRAPLREGSPLNRF